MRNRIAFCAAAIAAASAAIFAAPKEIPSPPDPAPGAAPEPVPAPVPAPLPAPAPAEPARWTTAVDPKPLSGQVNRGLKWIVDAQDASGGWSQGEESQPMHPQGQPRGQANVGDTAVAVLALVRSGSSPSEGPSASAIRKGLEFIFGRIEEADESSLSITDVNGTRLQAKLGPHIDTFLASIVLAEVRGKMPDAASEARLEAALSKVLHKIEANQQADGMWAAGGWAPALADAMALKGVARATQAGAQVDGQVLERAQDKARRDVDAGKAFAAEGSAGVQLYSGAFNLSALQDSVNSNELQEQQLMAVAQTAAELAEREEARRTLASYARTRAACDDLRAQIAGMMDNQGFIAGFGSNGGEEFLSYMNIAESLVVKGGEAWEKWDAAMTRNLERVQNSDGSWTGHHCITGRTFCTASALLVLLADRTPVPVEALAQAPAPEAAPAPAPGGNEPPVQEKTP